MTTETKKHEAKKSKTDGNPSQPVKVFRCGAIAASVWPRQTATGFRYLEFSLSRSWKTKSGDKEGYSQNFFENNEEALMEVIQDASEFIRGQNLEQHGAGQQPAFVNGKDDEPLAA